MDYRAIINQKRREQKQHGTPLFPVGCYEEDLRHHGIAWHWHEEMEAVVIAEGTALFVIDGKKFRVNQGEGVFINANVLHSVWAGAVGPCVLRTMVFHPRLIGSVDSIFWERYLQPLLNEGAARWVVMDGSTVWHQDAIQSMTLGWESFQQSGPGYELVVRERLSHLVFLLVEHGQSANQPLSDKTLRSGERLKQMLHYIEEHLADEITVSALAASAGLSQSECLRCFRTMVNTSPMQYVKQLRLQRAAILLEKTDWKISDIAFQCGFQEMSYFSKSFRQWKGCTPREYRDSCGELPAYP